MSSRQSNARMLELEKAILDTVENEQQTSESPVRQILGVPQFMIWRVINGKLWYTYNVQLIEYWLDRIILFA